MPSIQTVERFVQLVEAGQGLEALDQFYTDDVAVIRWIFDYVDGKGRAVHFEELAYQRWAGDRIAEERFFYDPGQFTAR